MGGDAEDGDGGLVSDLAGGFEAVHDGHLNIEEDDVEVARVEEFERLGAVFGESHEAALFVEECHEEALVGGVVFGQKNAKAGQAGSGLLFRSGSWGWSADFEGHL